MRVASAIVATLIIPQLVAAQQIPGRDLFDFPLGSVGEAGAISLASADGLRNPASILLPSSALARLSISSLLTGSQQGVSGQVASAAYSWEKTTFGLSVARASVSGISRTDSDPQSIGGDVPYNGLAVSAMVAKRQSNRLSGGLAVRVLHGELDVTTRTEVGIDAGVVAEHLTRLDARLAASSFFWRPGTHSGDGASFSGAADLRALGTAESQAVRAGYAFISTPGTSTESYLFTSARWQVLEARTGVSRSSAYSHESLRWRLAVGLHVERYFVAIAREDSPAGLAPSYQFTLTSLFPRL
ncbi:MAG: hypothetical protein U0132_10880 [Gemmatimonadaceae bacterium]